MTPLTAIPLSDIKFFLTLNEQSVPVKIDDIYSSAWVLIQSGAITSAPPSVTDWIISYNLLHQKINIPIYKTSEILLSPDKDLKDLANLLTLPIVDKESIIRILGYLNVLNNDIDIFEALPQEILGNIIKELDCKSILLICKSSKKFNKFCDLKLDELLKQKLYKETGFITDKYNREELIGLCRLHSTKHISVGENHSLILKDGQVYSFGNNSYGQLGLGNMVRDMNDPTLIPNLNNIKYISTGFLNSWALNIDEQVYSWGFNKYSQLGLEISNDIIQISSGYYHSLVLSFHNEVYSLGNNEFGQLGLGDIINRYSPTLMSKAPNNTKYISTGLNHSLALTKNGTIYSWGGNELGQLGLGDYDDRYVPTLVQEAPTNIIQISSGNDHSLCLTNDGHMYSCGDNMAGQLGLGDYNSRNILTLIPDLNNIIQISAGGNSSLALSNTGEVYAFGENGYGQLGLEHYNNINMPTLVLKMPNNIIQIEAGSNHSLVLRADGHIYVFGSNEYGQLGLGHYNTINIPILIPNFNVLS